jgi:Ca2+-binding RTX toxin-like protein
LAEQAVFDAVHVNSEFAGSPSDHDPILARLTLGSPGRVIEGTNKADVLLGGAGADTIKGGNGKDLLEGAGGADLLEGGNGADTLIGGAAADTLLGGNGPDVFVFAPGSGRDAILDFGRSDSLSLRDGLVLERREEVDTDADGRLDTVLTFGAGVVVTLFDVSGLGNSLDLLG